ncbi:helix-turn-helix transcriptional regulator [Paenibacillus arenilitoris]|uniref:YafY family transcriptional regulator n=1 Tax=Paenibacillus arenilitoris TaxID=2772299 RepID=A0A927CTT2_9BACL|nr:YafY family protein [Paenibacillus arenilitoris]MBD2871736.1 YafY family transcriptional regulator [Paenibacillus arenilitoris]
MKLDRLLAITMALLNKKRIGAAELAERFEVSLRTVYRDMEAINAAGIPIASFAGLDGGYEIMEGYRLERQSLSLDDFSSIYNALRGMQSVSNDQDIAGLLDRIGSLIPAGKAEEGGTLNMDLQWLSKPADKEKIRLLHGSIKESRLVAFDYMDYYGQETGRRIEPMGIYLKGNAWYVWGYCLTRLDVRVFRLSRINRLERLQEGFSRRPLVLEDSPVKWPQEHEPRIEATLHFNQSMKTKVRDEFEPEQITALEDGTIKVIARFYSEEAALRRALGYGKDAVIVEPKKLVDAMKAHLADLARLYQQ